MNYKFFRRTAITLTLGILMICSVGYAENIDPDNNGLQYAWGENVGWINFKPSQGEGVMVTDSSITGKAWGENIGWINLSPAGGGVINDGSGNLSGYAWGENVGWINFAPTGAGVKIDPLTGVFSGYAWGENIGWIKFAPNGKPIKTSWRGVIDNCPEDPNKTQPGVCGCGVADTDSDGDGTLDCSDGCPNDPNKTESGVCGCGVADTDTDGDGTADCKDQCPNDPGKAAPGVCGCGVPDTDSDSDGKADCIDNCPSKANPDQRDIDSDGTGDVCDVCPNDSTNTCNQNRSGGGSIGSGGGTITTPDGSITIEIPPGALESDTSISITETGTSYELTTNLGNGTALFGVTIQPAGLEFKVPITITFSWSDEDDNGRIDNTNIKEENVIITKDNNAVTDRCRDEPGPVDTTGAECNTAQNYFKFQVSSLSDFTLMVLNGPPIVGDIIAPVEPQQVNTEIKVSAPFTDPGFTDTHTATWNWGDGTTSDGTVTEAGGEGTVTGNHTYEIPGVYIIN